MLQAFLRSAIEAIRQLRLSRKKPVCNSCSQCTLPIIESMFVLAVVAGGISQTRQDPTRAVRGANSNPGVTARGGSAKLRYDLASDCLHERRDLRYIPRIQCQQDVLHTGTLIGPDAFGHLCQIVPWQTCTVLGALA